MSFIMVYTTHSSEGEANRISQHLLDKKLIACANIFPMSSAYWWQNTIQNEAEWVAIVKTSSEKWAIVKSEIERIHPYETPCIIKITVEANEKYERWIRGELTD